MNRTNRNRPKKRKPIILFALLAATCSAPTNVDAAESEFAPPTTGAVQTTPGDRIAAQWNLFAALYGTESYRSGNANRMMAPHSLAILMRLLHAGAAGETASQFESLFPAILESGCTMTAEAAYTQNVKPVTQTRRSLGAVANSNNGYGLVIRQIVPGQAAEKAGLCVNDLIFAIDEKPTRTADDLDKCLYASGDAFERPLNVRIFDYRQSKVRDLKLVPDVIKSVERRTPALSERRMVLVQSGLPLLPDFAAAASNRFGAKAFEIDFRKPDAAAFESLCGRLAEWTGKPASSMRTFAAHTPETRVILGSVLEFRSPWIEIFPQAVPGVFYDSAGKPHQTMFFGETRRILTASTPRFEIAEIPYQEDGFSFVLILPKQPGLLPALDSEEIKAFPTAFEQMKSERAEIRLPRFAFESTMSFNNSLKALGLRTAYSQHADFSRMTDKEPLRLSDVRQNCRIDFNPNGTVASSTTKVELQSRSVETVRKIAADHPFLFLIIDRNAGNILFAGHVQVP